MSSQIINLNAGLTSISDDEPKEGRKILTFQPLVFATGLEIYEWNSKQLGNQPLTSIQSIWIDAELAGSTTAVPQFLIVRAGLRSFQIEFPGNATNPIPNIGPDPRQNFFLLPSSMPFDIQISCTLNLIGTVNIALYNFNVFHLGAKYARDVVSFLKHKKKDEHLNTGKS